MHKKIIPLILVANLIFCPLQKAVASPAYNNTQTLTENKLLQKGLTIVSLFAALWLTAPEEVQKHLNSQISPKNLLKNYISEVSAQIFATLCHEYGHALAAAYFTGKKSEVHLGINLWQKKTISYKIANCHIDGINPRAGYTSRSSADKTYQEAIIHLAGGAGGLVGHHLFTFLKTYISNLSEGKIVALYKALKAAKKLDHISWSNIFNALLPLSKNSDASKLWRDCIGVHSDLIDVIIDLSPAISIAITSWYYSKKATVRTPLHSEVLKILLNFYLGGYLRIEISPD